MMVEVSPRTTALQQACEETRGEGAEEERMSPRKSVIDRLPGAPLVAQG